MTPNKDVVSGNVPLRRWRLGFKQFGFRHIVRVLQDDAVHVFRRLSLSEHAFVPISFRFQVSPVTQRRFL